MEHTAHPASTGWRDKLSVVRGIVEDAVAAWEFSVVPAGLAWAFHLAGWWYADLAMAGIFYVSLAGWINRDRGWLRPQGLIAAAVLTTAALFVYEQVNYLVWSQTASDHWASSMGWLAVSLAAALAVTIYRNTPPLTPTTPE